MPRVFDVIALVVTAVWVASFIAEILKVGYSTSPMMHTLMTAIIGAYAGGKILMRDKGDLGG